MNNETTSSVAGGNVFFFGSWSVRDGWCSLSLCRLSWPPSSELLESWWLSHKVCTYCKSLCHTVDWCVLVRRAEFLSCHPLVPQKAQQGHLTGPYSLQCDSAHNSGGVKSHGRHSQRERASDGASHGGQWLRGTPARCKCGSQAQGSAKLGLWSERPGVSVSANQTVSFLVLSTYFSPPLLIPSIW